MSVSDLRLIASSGEKEWDQFKTENGEIRLVESPGGTSIALPVNVRWRVEGSLRRNAAFGMYSPLYSVVQLPPGGASETPRGIAQVRSYPTYWPEERVKEGIVVCLWMVDGMPTVVQPVAATPTALRSYASVHAIELDQRTRHGYPLLLLHSQGSFARPVPIFAQPQVQRALEMMHLGTLDEFREAVRPLKSQKLLELFGQGKMTLVDVAFESGLADRLEVLAEAGRNLTRRRIRLGDRPITR